MKIITKILFLIIVSNASFALEWDSKEFNKSVDRWNRSLNKYLDNPGQIPEDIKNKYDKAIKDVKKPIGKKYGSDIDKMKKKLQKKKEAVHYLGERAYSYTNLQNGRALWYNLKYDWDYSFGLFWTEFVEEVPLVVPLKMEFQRRVDVMRIYPYLITPYLNNLKYKVKSGLKGK